MWGEDDRFIRQKTNMGWRGIENLVVTLQRTQSCLRQWFLVSMYCEIIDLKKLSSMGIVQV